MKHDLRDLTYDHDKYNKLVPGSERARLMATTKPEAGDPPPFHKDDGKQPPPEPEPEQEPKEQEKKPSRE